MSRASTYRLLGTLLIVGAAAWSGYATLADAPVIDESPHLAAGISYVQLFDYRLNPEHPPLEKLVAGIFVAAFVDPVLPLDAPWWAAGINEQWKTGAEVLWNGMNDPAALLALGRIGVLLLNIILLVAGWRALARRFGEEWGFGFLALTAASPFFLGHAHLITTDITAAGVTLLACFAFASFMERPTFKTGAYASIAFGFAQLAKFSLVLLIPTFIIVAGIVAWQRYGKTWRPIARSIGQALAVMAVGFAVVIYPTYLVLTWNEPAERAQEDARFLLGSFAGGAHGGPLCTPLRCVAETVIAGQAYAITRPAATYALGVLMVMQRSAGGNTIYFDGLVSSAGSKVYFPLLYLTKETLPALALVILGLSFAALGLRNRWRHIGEHVTPELALAVFGTLYVISTLRSSLNIGIRHIFPLIPIAYLFALEGWRMQTTNNKRLATLFTALIAAHVVAGALSLPYPLASYNSLGGGTQKGFLVAADSNYDWGQDALRLRAWMDAHPEAGFVAVDLFGGSDARALLGDRAVPWWSAQGNPQAYGIRWLAISSNTILNATGPIARGQARPSIDEYSWLMSLKGVPYGQLPPPDARAGTSIFLYKLD